MGGFELAARVRGAHPETRVLYLSGYSTETLEERADVGADAVLLQKPFTPDALLRTVREVLDRPDARPAR
jgi:CheY-like chemotaxis protein